MAKLKLTPEIVEILRRATIIGKFLYLPGDQLPRHLYQEIDKALQNLGGKWDTKTKAHRFIADPSCKVSQALVSAVALDEKKDRQAFYTPNWLADHLATLATVPNCSVLEPEAGHGAIATACRKRQAQVCCVENNGEAVAYLREQGFETIEADFLALLPTKYFDRVVMNPPFARDQDLTHVAHALGWLRPGGSITAILLNNQSRQGFLALTTKLQDITITELPRGTFKESGTSVATLILQGVAVERDQIYQLRRPNGNSSNPQGHAPQWPV